MKKMYYIGIDVGTSSLKTVLLDEKCTLTATASVDYEIDSPRTGWREIDPEVWVDAAVKAVSSLLANVDVSCVACIGVTGQMHTTVFVGIDGKPVCPAIMWNDSRTTQAVEELKEKYSKLSDVKYLSDILSTGSPAANLYWMKKYEPEQFERIHKFLIGPDYLVSRMTGAFTTDYCEASTSSLMDLEKGSWSESVRELLELPKELYPEIRGSAEIAGMLDGDLKVRLGLPAGVKVLVGTGDNPAAAIATGCLGTGYPVISLGTSGVLMFQRKRLLLDSKGKNVLFSFDGDIIYHLVQGVVQSTGNTVDWWNQKILGLPDLGHIDDITDDCRVNRQLLFYPHLNGDKTIYKDSGLRGAFLELSLDTTSADMVFAVLEGLCFAFRELVELMEFDYNSFSSMKVVGGGTNSNLWIQLLADILEHPVEKLEGQTGAGIGVALLAAYVDGAICSVDEIAEKAVSGKTVFKPRVKHREFYEKKYERYKLIYKGLSVIRE